MAVGAASALLLGLVVQADDAPGAPAIRRRAVLGGGEPQALLGLGEEGERRVHGEGEVLDAGLQGAAPVEPALVGVVGHGLGQLVSSQGGHGLQAGVEKQGVHVAFHETLAKAADLLVGAHGGDHHGRVLRLAHALVGGAAVEDRERAHELDSRLGVLRRQGADGGIEQLVDPARMQLGAHGVRHGTDGVGEHGIVGELGVEESLDDGRVDPLDGAVDFMDDVYLHGRLYSSNDSSGISSLGLFYQ